MLPYARFGGSCPTTPTPWASRDHHLPRRLSLRPGSVHDRAAHQVVRALPLHHVPPRARRRVRDLDRRTRGTVRLRPPGATRCSGTPRPPTRGAATAAIAAARSSSAPRAGRARSTSCARTFRARSIARPKVTCTPTPASTGWTPQPIADPTVARPPCGYDRLAPVEVSTLLHSSLPPWRRRMFDRPRSAFASILLARRRR